MFQSLCDRCARDLSQGPAEEDRDIAARTNFIAARAFAKQNFFSVYDFDATPIRLSVSEIQWVNTHRKPGIYLQTMNAIVRQRIVATGALLTSIVMAACGQHSTKPSTETFTVYEDAPKMSLLDLGVPGSSLGDVYHFSAPLHSSPGGPVTGELMGSKTLVKVATEAKPNLERRATLMFFTFADRKDQIIAFGVADYSPNAPEFEAGQPVVRAIIGGTGKYIGARGQLASMRNADGSYTQTFTLLK
jgi:hypothetical protein